MFKRAHIYRSIKDVHATPRNRVTRHVPIPNVHAKPIAEAVLGAKKVSWIKIRHLQSSKRNIFTRNNEFLSKMNPTCGKIQQNGKIHPKMIYDPSKTTPNTQNLLKVRQKTNEFNCERPTRARTRACCRFAGMER